jgi:protein TonB
MFETTIAMDTGHRRPWTVLAGLSGQLFALGIAMLLPLVYTDQLPGFRWTDLHILPPIAAPAPTPDLVRTEPQKQTTRQQFTDPRLIVPSQVPDHAQIIIDPPPTTSLGYDGPTVPGAIAYSGPATSTGIPNSIGIAPAPPIAAVRPVEAPKVAENPKPVPLRVSGGVQEAKILDRVIPTYPALARQARIQGTVELIGVIGKDGRVQQLRVISGHPLLINAALEAVKQWAYRPTLLNGEPVEVVAPISVRFTLT